MEKETNKRSASFICKQLLQNVEHLEYVEKELNEINATLEVNYGESGREAQLWSGDCLVKFKLMKVLDHLNSRIIQHNNLNNIEEDSEGNKYLSDDV